MPGTKERDEMLENTDGLGNSQTLDDLVARALRHLEKLRYSKLTVRNYGTTWRSYVRFAAVGGVTDRFSQEMADKFLADRGVPLAGLAEGLQCSAPPCRDENSSRV